MKLSKEWACVICVAMYCGMRLLTHQWIDNVEYRYSSGSMTIQIPMRIHNLTGSNIKFTRTKGWVDANVPTELLD